MNITTDMTTPHGAPELPEVVAFLQGEGPLDGVWFGEKHPSERGNFWWRKYLSAAIEQAAGAVPEVLAELLQSCRGSVKADLSRYEQMLLTRPSGSQPSLEAEADRLRSLLDSIDALPSAQQAAGAVPEGWRLVPVEITEDMHAAAVRTIIRCAGNDDFPPRVYRAMIAASPAPPKQQPDSVHLGGGEVGGVTQWQPIETAPKDGTYILLGSADGAWVARFHAVYQSGYRPENPWQSMMLNHEHLGRYPKAKPTHWMPLPPPPAPRPSAPTGQINPDSVAQGKAADHG